MATGKRKFGDLGENIAGDFLLKKGYELLEKNYHKKTGEIDIIARSKNAICFVEVKTRSIYGAKYGLPQEAVGYRKKKKLIQTALFYLLENKYPESVNWQIDVIAITFGKNSGDFQIEHLQNAVSFDDIKQT